jgi:hypothetical protein
VWRRCEITPNTPFSTMRASDSRRFLSSSPVEQLAELPRLSMSKKANIKICGFLCYLTLKIRQNLTKLNFRCAKLKFFNLSYRRQNRYAPSARPLEHVASVFDPCRYSSCRKCRNFDMLRFA